MRRGYARQSVPDHQISVRRDFKGKHRCIYLIRRVLPCAILLISMRNWIPFKIRNIDPLIRAYSIEKRRQPNCLLFIFSASLQDRLYSPKANIASP